MTEIHTIQHNPTVPRWNKLGAYDAAALEILSEAFDGLDDDPQAASRYGTFGRAVIDVAEGLLIAHIIDGEHDRVGAGGKVQDATPYDGQLALGRTLSTGIAIRAPSHLPYLEVVSLHTLLPDGTATNPPVYLGIGQPALSDVLVGTRPGLTSFIDQGLFDPGQL